MCIFLLPAGHVERRDKRSMNQIRVLLLLPVQSTWVLGTSASVHGKGRKGLPEGSNRPRPGVLRDREGEGQSKRIRDSAVSVRGEEKG